VRTVIVGSRSVPRDEGSGVRGQGSGVRGQGSGVRGQESGVRGQGTGLSSLALDRCLLYSCPLQILITQLAQAGDNSRRE